MNRILVSATLMAVIAGGGIVAAQTTDDHAAHHPPPKAGAPSPTKPEAAQPGMVGGPMGGGSGMMGREGMMGPGMMGGGMMGMMGGGMCPMGAMGMMGGPKTKVDVKKTEKGVSITLTAPDAAGAVRLQKMAEAMRLMHEAMAQ
jgi:hypothetical protein